MTRNMKSAILIAVVILSISTLFVSSSSAGLIFNLQSVVQVSWPSSQSNNPIELKKELTSISLNIDYIVTRGIFGKRILESYSNNMAYVNLQVIDNSAWLSAYLETDSIPMKITDQEQPSKQATLFVEKDPDAPAYEEGYITLRVSVSRIGLIEQFKETYSLKVVSPYKSGIEANLPHGSFYIITPQQSTEIPIDFTNFGNAATKVNIEVVNSSKSFDITTHDVLVDFPDGIETSYLVIIADNNFEEETVTLKITPSYANDLNKKGEPSYLTLDIKNDGSRRDHSIDLGMAIKIVGVIIAILIAAILLVVLVKKIFK